MPKTTTLLPVGPHVGLDPLAELVGKAAGLQARLKAIIEALPRRATSAGDLARFLKMDRSSIWRVWTAAYGDSPAEAGAALSGETAIRRFVDALVVSGSDRALASSVIDAFDDFARCAVANFGDLATGRLALARASTHAFTGEGRMAASMFDDARFRQGIQAVASLRLAVRVPSQFENLVDAVHVRHFEGLVTLNNAASHLLQRRQVLVATSEHQRPKPQAFMAQPLGESGSLAGLDHALPELARPAPVITEASSLNGRCVWTAPRDASTVETRVSGGVAGVRGKSNICIAELMPACEAVFPFVQFVGVATEQLVPSELLIIEFYLEDAELNAGLVPQPRAFDLLHTFGGFPGMPLDIGNAAESVEHYPPGARRPLVQEVQQHAAILDAAERAITRTLDRLHLFRWRVPYPVMDVAYALCAGRPE